MWPRYYGVEEGNISKIYYAQCGSDVVSRDWVYWKIDGKKHKKQFNRRLKQHDYACFNLDKDVTIPEGAEVWLKVAIDAGETKNSRKDDTNISTNPEAGKAVLCSTPGERRLPT